MTKVIALDIDGVLLRGAKVLNNTIAAMKLLEERTIPFVLVTNGGGSTEASKAQDLTKKIGVRITPQQILLSHTPYKDIAEKFADKRVLALGHQGCVDVLKSYGFNKISTSTQLLDETPLLYPGKRPPLPLEQKCPYSGERVSACVIVHDPVDWGLDMQALTDVLLYGYNIASPSLSTSTQRVPFYSCNADLVYNTEYAHPRYTQGAFVEAFKAIYEQSCGNKLQVTYCGKPYPIQYRYAEKILASLCAQQGLPPPSRFYGIGDNPKSDIRGANAAGPKWRSILVQTGIFQGKTLHKVEGGQIEYENDDIDPAHVVVFDVLDAIRYVIEDNFT